MNEFTDSAVMENQDGWDDWNETAESDSGFNEPELNPDPSSIQEESKEQKPVDQVDDSPIRPLPVEEKVNNALQETDEFEKTEETEVENKDDQITIQDAPQNEKEIQENEEESVNENEDISTVADSEPVGIQQDQVQDEDQRPAEDHLAVNETAHEETSEVSNEIQDSVGEEGSVSEHEPGPVPTVNVGSTPIQKSVENFSSTPVQDVVEPATPTLTPEGTKASNPNTMFELNTSAAPSEPPIKPKEIPSNGSKVTNTDNSIIEYLQKQLEEQTQLRVKHENNYQTLLGKLSSMRTVFSKMKQSQEELEVEKANVRRLEAEKLEFIKQAEQLNEECGKLNDEVQEMKKIQEQNENFNAEINQNKQELVSLTSDLKQNVQEVERLKSELKRAKSETEEYLMALSEEKIVKNNLKSEIAEQKQLLQIKEEEKGSIMKENYNLEEKMKELEAKVKSLENEKKSEEASFQTRVNMLKDEVEQLKAKHEEDTAQLKQLELKDTRITELSNEVKEKQLQIGTLRHEAVVLNEHLTKALKLIRKDSSTESVDKLLVSNLFISFLNMPRGDTKKYEVLQLIANFLGWDETQKEHAGLIQNPNSIKKRGAKTESFVSLWTEFLEKETSTSK
ncbi:cis-Golgi structural organization protein [Komagataella phaffii CBS 7435]|uniref:Golgi matrix protein involved in the structural organization of the cis-Golgi n=2 Tax=Komagataella phaffii TaxID=460519 RepID=C4QXX9_KOMPG|nr:Golgi matrix protein involved in the structural organization of the cis-Golgi [Komagataella phaffii GS115]AOA61322.1 GQ67_01909T0 [Komagataella phaffii]CAH2446921.1 cis-Golgi structural organization protein [Komagataella phaffii CBS 7435]AOA65388.1 GQ68_01924T0 [Komagataella phaffii GS115]CAY68102.1 Golgi matrix protein involved in the structural organization of the cis-Golgi [Komagataella phaffii GS115]CCA37178.1 cis-Golgi structural organization protein [Komagataella phaffii CBS 7435]